LYNCIVQNTVVEHLVFSSHDETGAHG